MQKSSSTTHITDPIKQKQQISLLKELHRPLEEHWAHCKKSVRGIPLDPVGSDKLFKHHIARLQDIYINRKFDVGKPPHVASLSPVTHLYGPRGLQSNIDSHLLQKKHEQRETGWVNNFHLSHIDERNNQSKSPKRPSSAFSAGKSSVNALGTRSRSSSPVSGGRDSTGSLSQRSDNQQQPTQPPLHQPAFYDRNQRYRCLDESISNENLLLLGMYRFSEEQQQIYDNFVSMLSSFETIDVVSISI